MTSYPDRIAYLLVTAPGGADGLDPNDKGGQIISASFDLTQIEQIARKNGNDPRVILEKRIVEDADVRAALKLLDPLEKLLVAGVLMDERNHLMASVGR